MIKYTYETERLIMQVLPVSEAERVLNFMSKNTETFDKYEPARDKDFFTIDYQRRLLSAEQQVFLKGGAARFYVSLKEEPKTIIGCIHFYNILHGPYESCMVGYKFDPDYHHHGYAEESLEKGIEIMFNDVKLNRIEATVMPNNIPSIKLLERLDFEREGLLKKKLCINGKWEDHYLYAKVK